jgi:hypothetical protein
MLFWIFSSLPFQRDTHLHHRARQPHRHLGDALGVATGQVSGAGAVSVQVQYASGFKAVGPIRQGHFAIGALEASGVCAVRALAAAGAVLAETGMGGLGPVNCP